MRKIYSEINDHTVQVKSKLGSKILVAPKEGGYISDELGMHIIHNDKKLYWGRSTSLISVCKHLEL